MKRFVRTVKYHRLTSRIYRFLTAQSRQRRVNPPADVYVISYPKSGRTWLRVLVGKAICKKFGLPDELIIDTYDLTAAAGIPRTLFTHDSSSIKRGCLYYQLPTDKSKYAGKRVVFLARNIKDVLVSSYFQATRREATKGLGYYSGSIAEFVRSERFGARKVLTFYNAWYDNRAVPSDFLLIRYEDMHSSPADILTKTLDFIGVNQIESDIIKAAVEFATFDHMKELEKRNFFGNPNPPPSYPNDGEAYKMRRGIVEGYTAYLSEEDIRYIDQIMREMGCPFLQA